MQLNGAEIVIECLKEQGVDTVFGYPGGAILNVYDELYKHRDEIRHILTSHEQGAAHAADGYARATGKIGVCLATSGPGATNLVTGIATAYMDSIPIVAITCNVGVSLLGKDSFQEIDIAGITMPITKYSFIVKDVTKLAETIRKAFRIAGTGRPGPVLVDIPKDITAAVTEYQKEELGKYIPVPSHMNEEGTARAVHAGGIGKAICLCGRRRCTFRRQRGAQGVCGKAGRSGNGFPNGKRRVPRNRSPVYGDAGNARHKDVQLRGQRV